MRLNKNEILRNAMTIVVENVPYLNITSMEKKPVSCHKPFCSFCFSFAAIVRHDGEDDERSCSSLVLIVYEGWKKKVLQRQK